MTCIEMYEYIPLMLIKDKKIKMDGSNAKCVQVKTGPC